MDNQGNRLGLSLYLQVISNARKIPILLRSLFFRIRNLALSCIRWVCGWPAPLRRVLVWIWNQLIDIFCFLFPIAIFLLIYILFWW